MKKILIEKVESICPLLALFLPLLVVGGLAADGQLFWAGVLLIVSVFVERWHFYEKTHFRFGMAIKENPSAGEAGNE